MNNAQSPCLCDAASVQPLILKFLMRHVKMKGAADPCCVHCLYLNQANIGVIIVAINVLRSHRAVYTIHKQCIDQHIQDYVLNY